MVAILPILPAIGSLHWLIVALMSSRVLWTVSRRSWRLAVAFIKSSQWRCLVVLAGIGVALPMVYSLSVRALTEPSPKSLWSPIAFIPKGW